MGMGFRKYGRRTAMLLVILLPALLACTDDPVIGTSTGLLGMNLQSVGGAGRYNVSVLQITGVAYRSTDPEVQESLGGDALGLITFPINVNLGSPNVVPVAVGVAGGFAQPIVAGSYEVYELQVVQYSLEDLAPQMYGPRCPEKVKILALPNGSVSQSSSTRVAFNPPAQFTVTAEQRTDLLLRIDAPGLIRLFEDQYNCTEQAFCGSFPPPCLQFYRVRARPSWSRFSPSYNAKVAPWDAARGRHSSRQSPWAWRWPATTRASSRLPGRYRSRSWILPS
jgi:hypothetical protein